LTLTRDSIRGGIVQEMVRRSGLPVLSLEALAESRARLLDRAPAGDLWVFGYGSLIWNPAFFYAESRVALAHGWHRRFCLWTPAGRGTWQRPGLLLGLERGGACKGVAFRIRAPEVACELEVIWRREMVTGSYTPRWVRARTALGPLDAIAFTINRAHDRYAGRLGDEEVARVIAHATGNLGPCRDYLLNTVSHLEALGIRDRALERLRDRVLALAGEPPPAPSSEAPAIDLLLAETASGE
jgi:glutathione-specific gamma-glutamylcyclotransferase